MVQFNIILAELKYERIITPYAEICFYTRVKQPNEQFAVESLK